MERAEDEFIIRAMKGIESSLGGEEVTASFDCLSSLHAHPACHLLKSNISNDIVAFKVDRMLISATDIADLNQFSCEQSPFSSIASASTYDISSSSGSSSTQEAISQSIVSTTGPPECSDLNDTTIHIRRTSCARNLPECTDGLIKMKRTNHSSIFSVSPEPAAIKRRSKLFGMTMSIPLMKGSSFDSMNAVTSSNNKSSTGGHPNPNGWLKEQQQQEERRRKSLTVLSHQQHMGFIDNNTSYSYMMDSSRSKILPPSYCQRAMRWGQGRQAGESLSLHGSPSTGTPTGKYGSSPSPGEQQQKYALKKHSKKFLIQTFDGKTKLIDTGGVDDYGRRPGCSQQKNRKNRFELEKEKQLEEAAAVAQEAEEGKRYYWNNISAMNCAIS